MVSKVFMYATTKAIAAFNVGGLPCKRVCARKLINYNNIEKNIFCVPSQPLLEAAEAEHTVG